MKTKKTVIYMLVLLLSGCLPSIHKLYTDETLVFEEGLIGKWVGDEEGIWQFRKAGDKEYELRIYDMEKEYGSFEAHLVKIQDMLFLDLYPDSEQIDELDDFYKMHLLAVHTFMKVDQIEPNLQLRMIDYEKVENILENDPNVIKHEIVDDRIVLTATTEELQRFVIEYVKEIFMDKDEDKDDSSDMTRLEPLYSEGNIVFDSNFVGQWKNEDGGVLYSKRMGENSYELMYAGIDETEQKVYANLLRHGNELLMALFTDKGELDPGQIEAYAFHLIPDRFFRIEKTESELKFQQISYKEASQILRNNTSSVKLEPVDSSYLFKGTRIEP